MNDERPAPSESGEAALTVQPCESCDAEARLNSNRCEACATGAELDPNAPLPPLPDGGLAASMPTWLRTPASLNAVPTVTAQPAPQLLDVSTILTDDDLPNWLKRIADRRRPGDPTRAAPAASVPIPPDPSPTDIDLGEATTGAGASLPPLPSSLIRTLPRTLPPRPPRSEEIKERLMGAALAIVAIILLVLIFLR